MSQLKEIVSKMNPTTSSAQDFLSMKTIKEAGEILHPHLLHMVNSVIRTSVNPSQLKLAKIVPITKPNKDQTTQAGWRLVNIVPTLSKIIEKFLLRQIMDYLKNNNFINHSHHWSIQKKRT